MSDLPPRPGHPAVVRCPHCQRPLPTLRARLAPVCEQPACRYQHDVLQHQALRTQTEARLRQALAPRMGTKAARQVPMVWIQSHGTTLQALPAARRRQHLAHLQQQADRARIGLLAGTVGAAGTTASAEDASPEEPREPPAAADRPAQQLCSWCSGRCCRFGCDSGAYIDADMLLRWVQRHPGKTLDDAVLGYDRLQPALHVRDSCVYHGAEGCALPRDMRSDTCNAYACEGLRQVLGRSQGRSLGPVPAADEQTWVFLMTDKTGLRQARLATPEGVTPLRLHDPTTWS